MCRLSFGGVTDFLRVQQTAEGDNRSSAPAWAGQAKTLRQTRAVPLLLSANIAPVHPPQITFAITLF
jgi:hypothetical protein